MKDRDIISFHFHTPMATDFIRALRAQPEYIRHPPESRCFNALRGRRCQQIVFRFFLRGPDELNYKFVWPEALIAGSSLDSRAELQVCKGVPKCSPATFMKKFPALRLDACVCYRSRL